MIHALIYHGFPIKMLPAQLERSLYHDIINQIDKNFSHDKNLVINGTWLNWDFQHAVEALLSVYEPDNVFIGSMVDPWEMQDWAQDKFADSRIFVFGNVSGIYSFNFWALHCDTYFPKYSQHDLNLNDESAYSFLCYQLKPKLHRQLLVHKLIDQNINKTGIVTLDDCEPLIFPNLKKITVNDYNARWKHDYDSNQPGIGNLEIWNQCFLNVVSETEVSNNAETFVSEKTWQPIIGMRPFVIHGDNKIYDYLDQHGFDIFADIFPVQDLKNSPDIETRTDIIIDVIQQLNSKSKSCLKKDWDTLVPRLQSNQRRFYEFAQEQRSKTQNLFI